MIDDPCDAGTKILEVAVVFRSSVMDFASAEELRSELEDHLRQNRFPGLRVTDLRSSIFPEKDDA